MTIFAIKEEDLRSALKLVEAAGKGSSALFEASDAKRPMFKRFMSLVGCTPPETTKGDK